MLDGDWFALLDGAARGDLSQRRERGRKPGAALAVVMAAEHYPAQAGDGRSHRRPRRARSPEGAFVFHAGTARDGDAVVTAGGRVLAVGA